MVFSSVLFLCYFLPIFLTVYFVLPYRVKNYWILLASMVFYAWGAPLFMGVVLAVLLIDYYLGNRIYHTEGSTKKIYLLLSILLNLGMLSYYKYSNFFVDNVNAVLGQLGATDIHWTRVALPLGISFFVFQEMSYTIDIYRGEHKPLKRFSDYMLFIFLFSHLVAGPIVTYHVLADDIVDRRRKINSEYRLLGLFRFMVGLARKVLIANTLATVANGIFDAPAAQLTPADCWLGAIAYTFQLYFDFSGYSDMAIGLGKMMGFDFPENFDNPYISQNITEFWRRWHITLGAWMRRYLYIPLGGNRGSEGRTYANLWTVFILSGLWHGASWTFVVWGIYHGFFIVCDRLFLDKAMSGLSKNFRVAVTFVLAVIGWVLFRADTLTQAFALIGKMFTPSVAALSHVPDAKQVWLLVLAAIISFGALVPWWQRMQEVLYSVTASVWANTARSITAILFFILSLSAILSSGVNPFIYFRF